MQTLAVAATGLDGIDDLALVERARNRDGAAVRLIMQRHNRQLYRMARGVLNGDAEAEDVVQEAYVRAFTHPATPSDQRDHFGTSRRMRRAP